MSTTLAQSFIKELDWESAASAKLLARVPVDKLDWRPHPRSSSLGTLAWHIANIPRRISGLITAGSFDLATAGQRSVEHTDFVAELQSSVEEAKRVIGSLDDESMLSKTFRFVRNGETLREMAVLGVIRSIMLNHTYHHRGQMTVYLRLLDVPVPAMYGNTADENPFA